jgi:hypothetical protein
LLPEEAAYRRQHGNSDSIFVQEDKFRIFQPVPDIFNPGPFVLPGKNPSDMAVPESPMQGRVNIFLCVRIPVMMAEQPRKAKRKEKKRFALNAWWEK